MTRPYSNDLLERVVRAHLNGEPPRSVVARFGVSVFSAPKWGARYRATRLSVLGQCGRSSIRLERSPFFKLDKNYRLAAGYGRSSALSSNPSLSSPSMAVFSSIHSSAKKKARTHRAPERAPLNTDPQH